MDPENLTHRLADGVRRGLRRALAHGTRRGALLASALRGLLRLAERHDPSPGAAQMPPAPLSATATDDGLGAQYQEWMRRHMPDFIELELMRIESAGWGDRPLVTIVIAVQEPRPELLEEAIASVMRQTYSNWELCIADDASADTAVLTVMRRAAEADDRVRIVHGAERRGRAATSNAALELATGALVTFLEHDGALRRHALHRIIELFAQRGDIGVVYTDEDRLLPSQEFGEPFFKPAWSPDLLLSTDYLGHLTVIRRELVEAAGGFRREFEGAHEHDLFLRVTELAAQRGLRIDHLPDMLYIGRKDAAAKMAEATADPLAGRRTVQSALKRRGCGATVLAGPAPGWYHVRYPVLGRPSVAIVVPTRDRVDLLRACIESIETRSTYGERSLLIVDNGSSEEEALRYLDTCPHRVIRDPSPFNFSRIMNMAVGAVDAEHVVLLNNDVTVITPDWLEAMLEHSQRPDVGAVGCRLLYPDGRPQHEGVAVGVGTPALNLDLSALLPALGLVIRDVTAVTAACMMMRRTVYQEMGGMDETLRVAFNDVDLCLRLRRAGYRILYTPLAQLYHHESASRGGQPHEEDDVRFATLWGHHRGLRDAFVNPHLEWVSPVRLRPF